MNKFFISGMGRSGTTLLDKLLLNHENLKVLSQPFPLLFVKIKKKFLSLKGINKYYVLNDSISDSLYDIEEFVQYLNDLEFKKDELVRLFNSMDEYDGQYTKRAKKKIAINQNYFKNFLDVFDTSLNYFNLGSDVNFLGIKETLCEEYMPYLCNKDIKCLIIVRDPRDVLASANYPKDNKYFGDKKPTLFLLRTWRKSVEFIKYLQENKHFYYLRYEDLVNNPYEELDKVTNFLKVKPFVKDYFKDGILDQNDDIWLANSSYTSENSFISTQSIGAYKRKLSKREIAYVESICKTEMEQLGYEFEIDSLDPIREIKSFKDYDLKDDTNISANYSSDEDNVNYELRRINLIQ